MFDNPSFWILFAGYTILWLVIGGYVFTLNRRQRDLEREIEAMGEQLRRSDLAS
ncbi:MAG: CcmD family protein [Dehalococcoidia bacterium]